MQLVLIVDDDVVWRANLARQLNKLPSIEAVEASCVREAVVLLANLEVDLVVTELRLADATAVELLPHLERGRRRIPMIVATGRTDECAARLPPGLEVRAKPIAPMAIRELVARTLGCLDALPPFTLAEYMQLASFGRHSVRIEAARDGQLVGSLVIREGAPWHAVDASGHGRDALYRMLAQPLVELMCAPLATSVPERNLAGSCEGLLIEAARAADRTRAGRRADDDDGVPDADLAIPVSFATAGTRAPAVVQIPPRAAKPAAVLPPVPPLARGSVATLAKGTRETIVPAIAESLAAPPNFEDLYGTGIEALLGRRYAEAFAALSRAKQIRSTPTLEANLNRLATMGFR